jgi:hypothetical protein
VKLAEWQCHQAVKDPHENKGYSWDIHGLMWDYIQ